MKFQKILFLLLMLAVSWSCWALSHRPEAFLKKIQGTPTEGLEIYRHFCGTCHNSNPQIKLGAPRKGVLSDWDFRFKNGLNLLLDHTYDGYNAMPARGGCFECTDEQLILALIELVPDVFKKDIKINLKAHKKNTE